MSLAQRDYLLRMIQQLAQALAAVVSRQREGKLDEALSMIDELRRKLFGSMGEPLARLDPPSVTLVLGALEKARAYAMILAVEADVRQARGETRAAARSRRRALEIHLEAALRWPHEVRDEDRTAITALAPAVDAATLSEQQRRALADLRGG